MYSNNKKLVLKWTGFNLLFNGAIFFSDLILGITLGWNLKIIYHLKNKNILLVFMNNVVF